jgi:hypothetical protein
MKRIRLAVLAALLAIVASSAGAQTRSSFVGTVSDTSGGTIPGATVTLESPDAVGGVRTFTTNERGEYRFVDLPPGTYELTASLTGFQTVKRTGLRIQFGTTLTVDLTLGVSGAQETVTVEGKAPTVDVTTAKSVTTVNEDLIQQAPTMIDVRRANDLISLSPGVYQGSAFGGATDANEVLFDGTPTTLPERQGINAIVINPAWMQEIQVVSLGAPAEYGEFSGTVANFVTRSGSNDFRGLVEYRNAPSSWVSDNRGSLSPALQARLTPARPITQWDGSAHIGGPLIHDKLFFFAGYQYIKNVAQPAGAPGVSETKQWRGIGKLSWAAAKNLKVDVTLQRNVIDFIIGPVIGQAAEVITDQKEPNNVWTARATWTASPKTLVEFRTGGLDYLQTIEPRNGGRMGTPSRMDLVTGIRSGNTLNWRTLDEKRYSGGVNVTRFADGFLGLHHELKAGLEYHYYDFFVDQGYTGGLSFSDRNGVPDQVEIWPGDVTNAIGKQTRAFVQDSWRVTDRITLEPGLRFTANRGTTPTTGPAYSTTYLSPRLGFAWDVTADHKTVVRAHYGHYHEAFGTISYQYTDTDGATPRITARVLPNGQFQELSRFTPAGNQLIDEDIRQPHYRQFVAGVERELISDFSAKVQYIHRNGVNLFGWVDPVTVYAPVQLRDPGPDNRPGTSDDGELFTLFNVTNPGQEKRIYTNPEGATRKYRALQFVVQKRFSHNWQMLAGYTYSKATGTLDNNQTDNYGRSQAPQTPFFNPNVAINYGPRNTIDFPHQFILRGSYRLPLWGGFTFGGQYRYVSGKPYSRLATFRLAQGNQQVRVDPRGAITGDATSQADVRVDKSFPIGGQRSISAYLDVFNVNNQGIAAGAASAPAIIEASGATFGQPAGWSSPRTFLVGARLSF